MVIREVLWLVLMIKQVTQKIARLGCDQYLVGALEHDLNFSIGNNHYPNWLSFFCRGVGIPPTKLAFRQVNAEMAIFQQTLHVQTLLRTTWVQNTWWLSITEISKEDTFYRVLNPRNAGERIFLVSILPQIQWESMVDFASLHWIGLVLVCFRYWFIVDLPILLYSTRI